MRKKSINELLSQFKKLVTERKDFIKIYSAYLRAFEAHFGSLPHTKEVKAFIEKHGCDYAN